MSANGAKKTRVRLFILNENTVIRVSPALAVEIGFNESIVLLQLEYLIGISTTELRDGELWTYQSVKELQVNCFPFWSIAKIWRVLQSLEKKELIRVANFNKIKFDRTCWYALNETGIKKLSSVKIDTPIFQNEISSRSKRKKDSINMQNGISILENPFIHDETTIPKTPTKTPTEIPTKTSSSSGDPSAHIKQEEEEGVFSVELLEELQSLGVYKSLYPEIAAAGFSEEKLFRMIEEVKGECEHKQKRARLFVYRIRNTPVILEEQLSADEMERLERLRRYSPEQYEEARAALLSKKRELENVP